LSLVVEIESRTQIGLQEDGKTSTVEMIRSLASSVKESESKQQTESDFLPLLIREGKNLEALAYLDQALTVDPNNIAALTNKATALTGLAKYDDALKYFDMALSLDPNYIPALSNIATTLSKVGKSDEAMSTIKKAIEEFNKSGKTTSNVVGKSLSIRY
jgi:tetratricopeptide (TPR) repeat protein